MSGPAVSANTWKKDDARTTEALLGAYESPAGPEHLASPYPFSQLLLVSSSDLFLRDSYPF